MAETKHFVKLESISLHPESRTIGGQPCIEVGEIIVFSSPNFHASFIFIEGNVALPAPQIGAGGILGPTGIQFYYHADHYPWVIDILRNKGKVFVGIDRNKVRFGCEY